MFNMNQAINRDDTQCIVVQTVPITVAISGGLVDKSQYETVRHKARIIHSGLLSPFPYAVAYRDKSDPGACERVMQFNAYYKSECGNFTLENIKQSFEVYVIGYFHATKGDFMVSTKQDKFACDNTLMELMRHGHKIVEIKKITLQEGNFRRDQYVTESAVIGSARAATTVDEAFERVATIREDGADNSTATQDN